MIERIIQLQFAEEHFVVVPPYKMAGSLQKVGEFSVSAKAYQYIILQFSCDVVLQSFRLQLELARPAESSVFHRYFAV